MKIDPLGDTLSNVELIDSMGNDLTVVNAARVSMAKNHEALDGSDPKLIHYLATHEHWTPFSHVMVTLRLKMPIFVARQWFKHQVGFTRNEVSRRYVDDIPEFFLPKEWRRRAESVKQGSTEDNPISEEDIGVDTLYRACRLSYLRMIEEGVAPEMARMILPQSMYTEFYETASLAAYARVCHLRLDSHAQLEIRRYAEAVDSIMENVAPISWNALS